MAVDQEMSWKIRHQKGPLNGGRKLEHTWNLYQNVHIYHPLQTWYQKIANIPQQGRDREADPKFIDSKMILNRISTALVLCDVCGVGGGDKMGETIIKCLWRAGGEW